MKQNCGRHALYLITAHLVFVAVVVGQPWSRIALSWFR